MSELEGYLGSRDRTQYPTRQVIKFKSIHPRTQILGHLWPITGHQCFVILPSSVAIRSNSEATARRHRSNRPVAIPNGKFGFWTALAGPFRTLLATPKSMVYLLS